MKTPSADIVKEALRLTNLVRDYSRSQRSLWRRVPLQALRADRTEEAFSHFVAFAQKVWEIEGTAGHNPVYVDLSTGEIIDRPTGSATGPGKRVIKPASDEAVLALALHPKVLDARQILRDLEKKGGSQPLTTQEIETAKQYNIKIPK